LPIFYIPVEKLVNPVAITLIFRRLDCPQNEHYRTSAEDRKHEKKFGDQIAPPYMTFCFLFPGNVEPTS
jgi:hypothetical protein